MGWGRRCRGDWLDARLADGGGARGGRGDDSAAAEAFAVHPSEAVQDPRGAQEGE